MGWSRFLLDCVKIYAASSAKCHACLSRPHNIKSLGAQVGYKKRHAVVYMYEITLHLDAFLTTRTPH